VKWVKGEAIFNQALRKTEQLKQGGLLLMAAKLWQADKIL